MDDDRVLLDHACSPYVQTIGGPASDWGRAAAIFFDDAVILRHAPKRIASPALSSAR